MLESNGPSTDLCDTPETISLFLELIFLYVKYNDLFLKYDFINVTKYDENLYFISFSYINPLCQFVSKVFSTSSKISPVWFLFLVSRNMIH